MLYQHLAPTPTPHKAPDPAAPDVAHKPYIHSRITCTTPTSSLRHEPNRPLLAIEPTIILAQIDIHIPGICRAESRIDIIGSLIRIDADLIRRAANLHTSSRALPITSGADLDIVRRKRRADEPRASAVQVAEVPVQTARAEGVLELEDTVAEAGVLGDLHARALAVVDPA